jgi:hypothetical protein
LLLQSLLFISSTDLIHWPIYKACPYTITPSKTTYVTGIPFPLCSTFPNAIL